MYLDFLVKIPINSGKITYRKKGETDYIYYEYTRNYQKGTNITNPKRATIGKRDTEDPTMMIPNENYLKYFPDEDIPEINERSKRSSCLRIGAWLIIRKIIEEYSDDEPYPSCLIYGTTGQRRPLHVSMCLFKRRELGYNYRCLSTGSPEVDGL